MPFPLNNNTDPDGLECMLKLYKKTYKPDTNTPCHTLSLLFPQVQRPQIPPAVTAYPGNFACFALPGNESGTDLGSLPDDYCMERINKIAKGEGDNWVEHDTQRADVWWLCEDKRLRASIPANSRGDCALVQLAMPLRLLSESPWKKGHRRSRRDTSPAGSFDPQIYIDEIGVPCRVPSEFKARNHVAAGFESLLWWVTVKKKMLTGLTIYTITNKGL